MFGFVLLVVSVFLLLVAVSDEGLDFQSFVAWCFCKVFVRPKKHCAYAKVNKVIKHLRYGSKSFIKVETSIGEATFMFTRSLYDCDCVREIEHIPLEHHSDACYGWNDFPLTTYRPTHKIYHIPAPL